MQPILAKASVRQGSSIRSEGCVGRPAAAFLGILDSIDSIVRPRRSFFSECRTRFPHPQAPTGRSSNRRRIIQSGGQPGTEAGGKTKLANDSRKHLSEGNGKTVRNFSRPLGIREGFLGCQSEASRQIHPSFSKRNRIMAPHGMRYASGFAGQAHFRIPPMLNNRSLWKSSK